MNKNENNKVFFPRKLVYFEKQKNDRLCGLHALNSLLQGPYFDVGQLSEIGLGLNEMERQIMDSHANVSKFLLKKANKLATILKHNLLNK